MADDKLTKPQLRLLGLMKDTTYERYTVCNFIADKMWPKRWKSGHNGVSQPFKPARVGAMLWRLRDRGFVGHRHDQHQGLWYITDKGKRALQENADVG